MQSLVVEHPILYSQQRLISVEKFVFLPVLVDSTVVVVGCCSHEHPFLVARFVTAVVAGALFVVVAYE